MTVFQQVMKFNRQVRSLARVGQINQSLDVNLKFAFHHVLKRQRSQVVHYFTAAGVEAGGHVRGLLCLIGRDVVTVG